MTLPGLTDSRASFARTKSRRPLSATPSIVCQPLPAHRAEVAQEAPRVTDTSPAVSDERVASYDECENDGQGEEIRHAVDLRKARMVQRVVRQGYRTDESLGLATADMRTADFADDDLTRVEAPHEGPVPVHETHAHHRQSLRRTRCTSGG